MNYGETPSSYDYYSSYRNYDDALHNMLFNTFRGRCIDYATAFVLMCRANGIPAQLAVGFAPGDIEDPTANERVVRIGHGHAWGEVLLTGVGWLPFEVSPNRAIFGNTTGVHSSGADPSIISVPMDATNNTLDHIFNGTGGGTTTQVFLDLEELINHPKIDSDMDGTPNAQDPDDDNDGISDKEELKIGTHPLKKDTDGDGLSDYEELITYETSPVNADTDNDGLTDYYEIKISKTDPFLYDTDGGGAYDALEVVTDHDPNDPKDDEEIIDSDDDGLSDAREKEIGTDPFDEDTDDGGATDGVEDASGLGLDPVDNPEDDLKAMDSDYDGLMDAKEIELGSDRFNPDTDYGGIRDGLEYYFQDLYLVDLLNGSDDYKLMDDDGDGLYNIVEEMLGTDPDDSDSDNGGVDDGVEVQHNSDPLDPSDDAEIDSDNDGLPNLIEEKLGTDPFDKDTDNDGLPDGWIDFNKNGERDPNEGEDLNLDGYINF
ncbi:MAG: hypothetical protein KAJ51_11770, partial [Thermoplasmata archaeon]|nr:hypothetical protein [Thermoplasmata archaeon]